jgi:invasion protein IalB
LARGWRCNGGGSTNDKDSSPVELNWRNCTATGCVAEAKITDDILKRWRAQTERASVQIKDASGRDVAIPFSFRGIAQALDALAKG